jgi:dUTP pyrophosphatase
MKVKFAKLDSNAVIPAKAKQGDAGFDLTAISYEWVANADVPYYNYRFGLAVEIPVGHVGLIFPRSSCSNKDVMLSNAVGVVDSGYRGELTARFKTTHFKGELPKLYQAGERVAQLVILPCPDFQADEVCFDELSVTERGTGGFGSSGK